MVTAPVRLEVNQDFSGFNCGNEELNRWLKLNALRAERERTATTYVILNENAVVAYYSLAAHSVERETIGGGRLARNSPNQVPALLLARLAVDNDWQNQKIGSSLLAHAITTARTVSDLIGMRAIVVDPIDDGAAAFYARYGFRPFPSLTKRMFYPL